jgi:hypothetical protein
MHPISFKEANKVLGPPVGVSEEECLPLPVFTDGEQCISKWKLTADEIEQIKQTGEIWVSVYSGVTQPPILPLVGYPFRPIEP